MALVIASVWRLSAAVNRHLDRWAPSRRLLRWLRTRQGLKWGMPAACGGLALVLAGIEIASFVPEARLPVLYLPAVLLIWDGFKLAVHGPISLLRLGLARLRERTTRRASATR
jgi:hypothetical protein